MTVLVAAALSTNTLGHQPLAIGNQRAKPDYVCDGYLPVQERDASGNVLVTYTRGLDLTGTFGGAGGIGGLLARTDSGGSAFYHGDVGGNITSLTDSSGNAVARYLNDPFGRPSGMWGPLAGPNVMRCSSMPYYDQAGAIGYCGRFYDPILQRWLNQDPIGEAGGINLYGFVGNNPISRVDPYGLSWLTGPSPFPGQDPAQLGPYALHIDDGRDWIGPVSDYAANLGDGPIMDQSMVVLDTILFADGVKSLADLGAWAGKRMLARCAAEKIPDFVAHAGKRAAERGFTTKNCSSLEGRPTHTSDG